MSRSKERDLLVHVCCAPCASASLERLSGEGYTLSILWSNANIYPQDEHDRRLDHVRMLADRYHLPLYEDSWDHDQWLGAVAGLEQLGEGSDRCAACFAFNFARTAARSDELGIGAFTTTLSISPYKSFNQICTVGSGYPAFRPFDFKKHGGYQRSIELSRAFGLYRQRYCGCEFSRRERA